MDIISLKIVPKRLLWPLAAGALLLGASTLAVAGWPTIPLPPNSQGELISGHMLNMGLEMQASTFVSSQPKNAVVTFYRDLWGDEMIETEAGGKTILAYATDSHLTSIELSPVGGRTGGTIGITRKMANDRNVEEEPSNATANDITYIHVLYSWNRVWRI